MNSIQSHNIFIQLYEKLIELKTHPKPYHEKQNEENIVEEPTWSSMYKKEKDAIPH